MKLLRGVCFVLAGIIVLLCVKPPVYAALTFKDVPADHWAYDSITRIAEMGLIMGDASGNYRPNDNLDKFETSKILAKAAGYKYTDVTAEEQRYFERSYEKNKAVIQQYSKAYAKWNPTADREIAFLLEKEILTMEDLNQFIVKAADKSEQLKVLTRQEACVFIVKLMGKKEEALSKSYKYDFTDNSAISATAKPYVYYLKEVGVLSGYEGSFNPNSEVTRAAMAVFLDNALKLLQEPQPSPRTSAEIQKVDTVSGTIETYFSTLNAVQLVSSGGERNIYKISKDAGIYIDTYLKTVNDLKVGMSVVGVVINNEIIDLRAQSAAVSSSIEPVTNLQLSRIEGIVTSVKSEVTGLMIGIEIRMLSPRGDVITDVRTYMLSSDCKIMRGSETVAFTSIVSGDVVSADVSGSKVYSITVEEKMRTLNKAVLTEKRLNDQSEPVYVIQDVTGRKYEFRVTESTAFTRNNVSGLKWNDIKTGDLINVTTELDTLLTVTATGSKTSVEGIIESITVDRRKAEIMLKDSEKTTSFVIEGSIDVYAFRVGSKVKLGLDSKEVESVVILESSPTLCFTGTIQTVSASTVTLKINDGGYQTTKDITINTGSMIIDSRTGKGMDVSGLQSGMRVYAVMVSASSNVAQTLTVLVY